MRLGAALARTFAASNEVLAAILEACRTSNAVDIAETASGARAFVVSALWQAQGGQFVVWTHAPDTADRFATDCSFYLEDAGSPVWTLRPRDEVPGALFSPTERSARMETLDALAAGRPGIYCISHAALRQPLMHPGVLRDASLRLKAGGSYDWEALLSGLAGLGYERVDVVSAVGEFAVHGGLIDVFPATAELPVRLEFFGDRLEGARTFALADQRSIAEIDDIRIAPWSEILAGAGTCVFEYAPGAVVVVEDADAIAMVDRSLQEAQDRATVAAADQTDDGDASDEDDAGGDATEDETSSGSPLQAPPPALDLDRHIDLTRGHAVVAFVAPIAAARLTRPADLRLAIAAQAAPSYGRSIENFVADVRKRMAGGETIAVASVGHRRIREVLEEHEIVAATAWTADGEHRPGIYVADGIIDEGFCMPSAALTVLGDSELFGHPARRHKIKAAKEGVPITEADLKAGEHFVHAYHGIGQYLALEHLTVNDVGRDFILLRYAGEDRLYVPIDHMHMVRKYVASDEAAPRLSKMGGSDWTRTRSKVREAVEKIAEGLVQLYAEREAALGHAFAPDTPWQMELEESFPYDETPDQRKAIEATKADMERPRPMDRLVCGDVGYGKTEVAIRAAFKAIMDRKQVALLAPTTVLAAQHFRTFGERFAAFPVKIGLLSRYRSKAQQKETLREMQDGSVDLVIGTHRLLQKDIGFARLGLITVDEEQRFGVMHKERLKEMRRSVDVLTLSATPIPRTLHMSMVGIRDLSLIQTAPVDRMAIKTVVAASNDALIASAVQQELDRGGQVYFVHNRIETIAGIAAALQALVPRARIHIGHGQMKNGELEDVMVRFVNGEFDVLLSTTIIENGLDIPNVNTIVVNNADHFGLAQLYQLRGRVGRSAHQAYAYFLYQPHRKLSEVAQARLQAIREFSHLGSGLRLAMRDLEIRGAGNLLGHQQHGFIAAVGFDTYCEILQEAVAARRGQPVESGVPPPILDIRVSAYIPADYMKGTSQKIAFYQRLAAARAVPEIDAVGEELRDRFGPHPKQVESLLELSRLRVLAAAKGVEKLSLEQRRLTLEIGRHFSLSDQALPALASITRGNFRFTEGSIVAHLPAQAAAGDGQLAKVRELVAAL